MTKYDSAAYVRSLIAMLGLLLAGCSDPASSGSFRVVLLGDATRFQVLSALSDHEPVDVALSSPPVSSSAMDVADVASTADFALIVTDATVGPTPVVREHIILARQLRIPTVGLVLSSTDALLEAMAGDRDLHDLVELELREVLSTYELAGDTAPHFYDSETFEPSSGLSALAARLGAGDFPARAPVAHSTVSGSTLDAEITCSPSSKPHLHERSLQEAPFRSGSRVNA